MLDEVGCGERAVDKVVICVVRLARVGRMADVWEVALVEEMPRADSRAVSRSEKSATAERFVDVAVWVDGIAPLPASFCCCGRACRDLCPSCERRLARHSRCGFERIF